MLDLNIYEPSRNLNQEPLVILETEFTVPDKAISKEITYQFRYVVHRQHKGFFTPVVFDLALEYIEYAGGNDRTSLNAINVIVEPFIEGALFMDHASPFIVHMLKGQEAGFNRKEELGKIVNNVHNTNNIWYSDWGTPPITQQHQRIMVYDLNVFGSMLDPVNTVKQFVSLVTANRGLSIITKATVAAGYTKKTL